MTSTANKWLTSRDNNHQLRIIDRLISGALEIRWMLIAPCIRDGYVGLERLDEGWGNGDWRGGKLKCWGRKGVWECSEKSGNWKEFYEMRRSRQEGSSQKG